MKTTLLALAASFATCGLVDGMPPDPETGKVIILTTEQLLEGEIIRVDEHYRVRRSVGESLIPADQVLKLVQNRQEALEVIRRRSNARDPDERLRVARWCLLYGLRVEALAEAEAALKLRPADADVQSMVRGLQRLKSSPPPTEEPVPSPSSNAVAEELAT